MIAYQAIKQKDMKIRDLSGRKRLDDKHLDRRIKEREKAVFSILGEFAEDSSIFTLQI